MSYCTLCTVVVYMEGTAWLVLCPDAIWKKNTNMSLKDTCVTFNIYNVVLYLNKITCIEITELFST